MTINIEPTKEHSIPYDTNDVEPTTFAESLAIAANTHDFLEQLSPSLEFNPEDAQKAASTIKEAIKTQDSKTINTPMVAFAAKEFLRVYSARLAVEMNDVRAALTNKLMELANCGDPRFELKAIELLGKHSDIALFTERSEVTVSYKTSSDLEEAIKERVKRLLNAEYVDVSPITPDHLDDELGIAVKKMKTIDVEFVEPEKVEEVHLAPKKKSKKVVDAT